MGQVGYDGYQTSDSTADLIPKLQRRIEQLEQALEGVAYYPGNYLGEARQIAIDALGPRYDVKKRDEERGYCGLDAARKGRG